MSNGSPPARRRPSTSASETVVRSLPASLQGPALVCTAGPMKGDEFPLEEGEVVIGRSADNPICIQDSSVSRRHVMLRRMDGGWTVSDLGSGNGTLVNGELLSEERPLASGDLITLGDTELKFTDTSSATMMMPMPEQPVRPRGAADGTAVVPARPRGAADGTAVVPARPGPRPPPARPRPARASAAKEDPAEQRQKKRLMLAGAGVLAVLLSGLVILQLWIKAQERQQLQQAAEEQQQRARLGALFQEAKNLIRESKWAEAKGKLLELQALNPDYPGLQDYLSAAEREIPNQAHLKAAREALDKKELAAAATAVGKVVQSPQVQLQVDSLKRSLREAADKRVLEARQLLDGKQLDPARAITEDVLAAFPEHRDAKVIHEEAMKAIQVRDAPPPPPPSQGQQKPWDPAVTRFIDGDLPGAVALTDACASRVSRCKELLKQMTEFSNLYKRLEDLDGRGLSRLLALDKDITGGRGSSKMARSAGTRAANIFYKTASSAKAQGHWARAVEYARRTLQAAPDHEGASNLLTEVIAKAKNVYLQAYQLKDSNPDEAVVLFREVVAMTPSDDEYHQKARSWIEKLSK